MLEPCAVIAGHTETCDRGTYGCDACPVCICHACYGHPEGGCVCPKPTTTYEGGTR